MADSPITLIFLVVNVAFSLIAFNNMTLFQRFDFHVASIRNGREWHRLITSGFLHVSPTHLIVNMLSLYFCGPSLERIFGVAAMFNNGGPLPYILLYLGSLIGGNLLGLIIHREQGNYRAVGASGAISGLIFAIAVIAPEGIVRIFFFLPMPLWLFAILYVGVSLFGMRSGLGNIGHSAHLGGAIVGMLITMIFFPQAALENWVFLTLLLVPTLFALLVIILRPDATDNMVKLFTDFFQGKSFIKRAPKNTVHTRDLHPRVHRQEEIDRMLDKIRKHGIASLTSEEKRMLDEYSRGGGRHSDQKTTDF